MYCKFLVSKDEIRGSQLVRHRAYRVPTMAMVKGMVISMA